MYTHFNFDIWVNGISPWIMYKIRNFGGRGWTKLNWNLGVSPDFIWNGVQVWKIRTNWKKILHYIQIEIFYKQHWIHVQQQWSITITNHVQQHVQITKKFWNAITSQNFGVIFVKVLYWTKWPIVAKNLTKFIVHINATHSSHVLLIKKKYFFFITTWYTINKKNPNIVYHHLSVTCLW